MGTSHDAEFTQFVAERSAALFRTAFVLAGDRATAEDLLQTALTKTYTSWRRLRSPGTAEAYTRRILITTLISWRRRRAWRAERPGGDLPDEVGGADLGVDLPERDRVWQAVQALPTRQRAAVVLRFYEDLTERQTADILGCSTGTVKSQVHDALRRLRDRLGDPVGDELTGERT
jgi:RNA polymerase sigma-70 factor (sigma-E family)